MKITALIPVALLAVTLTGSIVRAQDNGAAATPPAPITINGVVHVQTLPTPPSLMKDAEAEGLTILRMDQSPDRIVVAYQYPNGVTRTFAYTTRVESSAPVAAPVAAPAASPVTSAIPLSTATYSVVSQAAPTTIVYSQPAPVYYTPTYVRYYDPYYYPWAPLALGVGIGMSWNHGYYGGHGHYYGGHGHYYGNPGRRH
jgi:hypothetical protein